MPHAPHLLHLEWKPEAALARARGGYPFSVPAVRTLGALDLAAPVVFFAGENGSGKSTLLEAIAVSARLPTLGGDEADDDATLDGPRQLARALRLAWSNRRVYDGFFLRAEDFFGYLKRQARNAARLEREDYERGGLTAPGTGDDAVDAARFIGRYDARSHGESFLDAFERRLSNGLYLLDEPEAPLSPQRQLALLALIDDAVRGGAQCIIATHSPILLGFPGARIYTFDDPPVREVAYDDLPHVTLTRDFLAAPERFFKYL